MIVETLSVELMKLLYASLVFVLLFQKYKIIKNNSLPLYCMS